MLSVLVQALRENRTGAMAVALALFGFNLLIVYTFSSFGGLSGLNQMLELLPAAMRAFLKAQGGFATDAAGYMATQYRHPIFLVATAGLAIAAGAGMAAKEIERGSALLVLSAPIARWRYLAARMGATAISLAGVLAVAVAGTWLGAALTGTVGELSHVVFLKIWLMAWLITLSVAGVAALASARGSDGGQAIAIPAGFAVASFFLDFLAALWSTAEPFGLLSVYHYYDPLSVVQAGVSLRDAGVLTGVALVTHLAALALFQRRDIRR
ncbi:MAG: hypothetical protein VW450_04320 [Chloroflexota bacterium]